MIFDPHIESRVGVKALGVAIDLSLLVREGLVGEVHDLLAARVVHVGRPLLLGLGSGRKAVGRQKSISSPGI